LSRFVMVERGRQFSSEFRARLLFRLVSASGGI